MGYIGTKPSAVPLTSADITDGIIVNADINASAAIALTKLASTGTLTVDNIQFPATQVASANANNLDDYEEGTWTPVLGAETSSTGQTYTSQVGRYTKIGNRVYITGYVKLSAVGTLTGAYATIKGFPFTASASAIFSGGINFGYALNFASNIQSLGAYINTDNVAYICGAATTGTNVLPNLLKAVIGSTTEVAFIGNYIV